MMDSSDDEQNLISHGDHMSDDVKIPLIANRDLDNNLVPVKDRFNFVYIIFYLLGIGCLLPWNFFSNAKRYFTYKLRNCTLNETLIHFDDPKHMTDDQVLFINYLAMASLLPIIIMTFISIIITNKVSVKTRVMFSTIVLILLFLVTSVLTFIDTDGWQKEFLYISLATAVLMNSAVAILQGSLCGLAGKFPSKYMQSLMGGMGLGGFFAAASSLVIVSLDTHPVGSGFGYFVVATVTLVFCFLGFLLLPKIKFSNYYLNQSRFVKVDQDYVDIVVNSLTTNHKSSTYQDIVTVLGKIWVYAVSVCLTFTITLTCYPAIISAIQSTSTNKTWAEIYFSPVVCFLIFNFFDVIGRLTVNIFKWPSIKRPALLICLSILRLSFIPAFFFCNIEPRHFRSSFFTSDWVPAVLNVFLGWSNGHLATLCMMYAPMVLDKKYVELSGSIMAFFLSLGLGFGSLMSMLFMWKLI